MFRWAISDFRLSAFSHHRPELEDAEGPLALAHSDLSEEDRAARVELDERGDDGKQRREQREPDAGADEVERPLEQPGRRREPRNREPDEWDPLDRVQLRARPEDLEHARDDVDLDVVVLHRSDDLERLLVRVGRERDDDAVDRVGADEVAQVLRPPEQVERARPVR